MRYSQIAFAAWEHTTRLLTYKRPTTHKRISLQFANIFVVRRFKDANKLRVLWEVRPPPATNRFVGSKCLTNDHLCAIMFMFLFLECVLLRAAESLMSDVRVIYFKREKRWRCQIADCSAPSKSVVRPEKVCSLRRDNGAICLWPADSLAPRWLTTQAQHTQCTPGLRNSDSIHFPKNSFFYANH